MRSDSWPSSPTLQAHEILPPPAVVPSIAWRNAPVKLITTVPVDSVKVKAFHNDSVKIQWTDGKILHIVQKYLKRTNTSFFTFPKPEEKNRKIIILGLTTDISVDELSTELKSQGYEVTFVRQFVKAGRKLPVNIVSLLSNLTCKNFFNLHSPFYISVKVEPYRSNNPAQCYNCQRFGHSSLYCGYPPPNCLKALAITRSKTAKDQGRGSKMHKVSLLSHIKL